MTDQTTDEKLLLMFDAVAEELHRITILTPEVEPLTRMVMGFHLGLAFAQQFPGSIDAANYAMEAGGGGHEKSHVLRLYAGTILLRMGRAMDQEEPDDPGQGQEAEA